MTEILDVNLSMKISLEKRNFMLKHQAAKKNHESWVKSPYAVFSMYLVDVYGINVPENFSTQISEAESVHHGYRRDTHLSFKHLDSIIQSCLKWLDFLEDSNTMFDQLVCSEVLSMAEIHTSVISARNISERPGIRLKAAPPYSLVTIVNKDGGVRVIS